MKYKLYTIVSLCMLSISSELLLSSNSRDNLEAFGQDSSAQNFAIREYIRITGYTPLHEAQTVKQAQDVIKYGPDINARDNQNRTPIQHRISERNTETALYLFDQGAIITPEDKTKLIKQCILKGIHHNITKPCFILR